MQTEQKPKKAGCNQETKETIGWVALGLASLGALVYTFTNSTSEESAENAKELLGKAQAKKSGRNTDAS